MKKQLLFALVAFAALSLNACSKDDSNGDESWKDEPREDVFIEFKDPNVYRIQGPQFFCSSYSGRS